MENAANRIIDLQIALNSGRGDPVRLQREQRELWDKHYPGMPYDHIVWDSWVSRRPVTAELSPRTLP